ncbi:MAG: SDR family NAD(P)-dependent oxidoreductase [Gemmatimonadota bacterium]|nr:SDR family NAD(P)-dependent oxidoreductase [Gemmatimonadota bacterium]
MGFAALADAAFRHFEEAGGGHLVGITSLAAVRASGGAPAYSASKTFASSYLAGLRHRALGAGLPITVTEVRPGFVDTAMAQGEDLFWVATPEEAASQIAEAIERRRRVAYVTRRWRMVAALLNVLPGWLYRRLT